MNLHLNMSLPALAISAVFFLLYFEMFYYKEFYNLIFIYFILSKYPNFVSKYQMERFCLNRSTFLKSKPAG